MQMQQSPDDLLSGTGRPGDQHPTAGWRHSLDLLPKLIGRRRCADKIDIAAGAELQLLILAPELCCFDRTFDDQQQPIGLEGLFQEIISADLDRFDRRLDRTVSADHYDGDRRHVGAKLPENLDSLESSLLKPDVKDDKRRLPGLDCCEGLSGVGSFARRITLILEHAPDQHADVYFVIDDQDVMRHGWPCSTPEAARQSPDDPVSGSRGPQRSVLPAPRWVPHLQVRALLGDLP